ncbi:hypothetical protein F2P56_004552 [Juglans regia]|uniref:Nuclear pore complex protein NUP98A-like n=1 Tax=Juglans regia TaxID=51240 RepID=A0A834D663_JUGRE|nr:hypothetical protein F2P56_004552 [Juglans regia]
MPTTEADSGTQVAGKLETISAMPAYRDKSHEELRWVDYQLEDKDGLLPASQSVGGIGFSSTATSSNILGPSTPFGTQGGGSTVAPYTPTIEADSGTPAAGKLKSISAMPICKDKSPEELRWEDYQLGDKGGLLPSTQPAVGIGFSLTPTNSNILGPSTTFSQSSASHFFASMTSNPFAPKSPSIGSLHFGSSTTPTFSSSPFSASTSSGLFGSTLLPTSSTFGVGSSPTLFGSSTPLFSFGPSQTTNTTFGSNTQSCPLFQSSAPSIGQTGSAFGLTTTSFGQGMSSPFGQGMLGASTL